MLRERACGWCEHAQILCEGSRIVSEKNGLFDLLEFGGTLRYRQSK